MVHPFRLGVTKNTPVANPDVCMDKLGSSMKVMTWIAGTYK
jgi:hypothetical protein